MRLKFRGRMTRFTDSRDEVPTQATLANLNERNARYWDTRGQLVARLPKDRYRVEERDGHFCIFDREPESNTQLLHGSNVESPEKARRTVSDSEAPMVHRLRAYRQLFQQTFRRIS